MKQQQEHRGDHGGEDERPEAPHAVAEEQEHHKALPEVAAGMRATEITRAAPAWATPRRAPVLMLTTLLGIVIGGGLIAWGVADWISHPDV